MPERITADELARIVQQTRDLNVAFDQARIPHVGLTFADWDHIIAALREKEARPRAVRWDRNFAYGQGHMSGYIWPSPDGSGRWAYKMAHTEMVCYAATEAEARAAVEAAMKGGAA